MTVQVAGPKDHRVSVKTRPVVDPEAKKVPLPNQKQVERDVALIHLNQLGKRQKVALADVERQVRLARRKGATWTQIGEVLGVSQQAASRRWGPYPPLKKKRQPAPSSP